MNFGTQVIVSSIAVVALAVLLFPLSIIGAKVEREAGLIAPNAIVFSCGGGSYAHTLDTVSASPSGDFTGTGTYDANNGYIWNITGNISGDNITLTIVYTGLNSGYTLNGTGTIAPDGSISGTTDGNCQTFSMPAGSAVQSNHGQWVSSQTDKQDAAQSRVGMPVQSKGHTK